MYRLRTGLFLPVFLSILLAGCGAKSANDQSIITNIQSKLYADATTKPASIGVAAKDGVVTLSGDVPSSAVELEAMKIANGTAGVRSVSDQMKINNALAGQLPNAGAPPLAAAAPESYPAASSTPPAAAPPSTPPPVPDAAAAPPPSAPAEPVVYTIPAGDRVSVRMIDPIDSGRNTAGQTFRASLDSPLVSHGRVVIPAGAGATVLLAEDKGAGRIKGRSAVELRLTSIEHRGRTYQIDSSPYEAVGKARGKNTAVRTGVGAGVGALIGALAGGGKGAAIGSAAGGGVGFGSSALTHGQQIKIPSESVITFRLEAPVSVSR